MLLNWPPQGNTVCSIQESSKKPLVCFKITHLRSKKGNHSSRTRHPGVQSQVGLRKHHYKVSGGDGIPAELFQILKDYAVKVLHNCTHLTC